MNAFGFSTGAVALGDFSRALALLRLESCEAVELSALREHELAGLMECLPSLDLSHFRYVSVHVPSVFEDLLPSQAITALEGAASRGLPLVLHPDAVDDLAAWRQFGPLLLIENTDKRKRTGRTVGELAAVFDKLPDARLCFDIAHARQVDPTMSQASLILRRFAGKIAQVHLSEINVHGRHGKLTAAATYAYPRVMPLIPQDVPVILESLVQPEEIGPELAFAREIWAEGTRRFRTALS
jgi:hypothetical protein